MSETELVPAILAKKDPEGNLTLKSIFSQLKHRGYMLDGALVYYFSTETETYIYSAMDPIPAGIVVPATEFASGNMHLTLRVKLVTCVEVQEWPETPHRVPHKPAADEPQKRRRTKERKIGQIIEQVSEWRRYYNGYTDYHGKFVKLPLEEAALKVGIPKKSLDDYFLQLRLGKKYGFNFNEHKEENVGVLRAFIKNKREEAKGKQPTDAEATPEEEAKE